MPPSPMNDLAPPTIIVPSPSGTDQRLVSHRGSTSSNAWQSPVGETVSHRLSHGARGFTATAAAKTDRMTRLRSTLTHSAWYHGNLATELRTFLNGKLFAIIMVIALLLALFMPDVWILAGMNSNIVIDVVLTIVMGLFTAELILLSTVEATYFLSFFQLMDVVGTISMIWDVSYIAGTDNTFSPMSTGNSDAEGNLMLLRASRAAKIGARAGRLSRVLRILRFLPFLTGSGHEKNKTGIASLISGRLANLLATRVACLTIVLVMVIPSFDIWTFPQSDFSLQTWVDRLSRDVTSGRVPDALEELRLMESFYDKYDHWPWMACTGRPAVVDGIESFECDDTADLSSWVPSRGAPPRNASSLRVYTPNIMVAFNMHATNQLKSGLGIVTIMFIIFLMIFSSLALSSVVTELAVRPLERMLMTVRQIASTVFKFSAEVCETEDEEANIESSNEMKLLERVVQKLAIVAELHTAKNIQATDDMRDEDIGILSMMQGKNVVDEQKAIAQARKSCAIPRVHQPRKKALTGTIRLEDFGVSQEVYHSWNFNALTLSKAQRISLAVFTISRFFDTDGFCTSHMELQILQRFVGAVEKEYLPVPFHSFAHAIDVLHGVSRLMTLINSETFLTELEQYVLLIAALAHDLGHPGVNNGFLSEVGHELALQYNDRSPLENMHCAKLYTLVGDPQMNVFGKLSKEQYREARKNCIEVILHTDMMGHGAMVKDLQMTYQMNQEIFNSKVEGNQSAASNMAEIEVFTQAETKMLVLECILHSADVSNPCRAWETTRAWAMVCLEEFFAQGDQEKMLGIPVQFLNDREKLNKPNSQIGFIEFMIAPFFVAQIRLWPILRELGDNLGNNLANWAELWEKEVHPHEEERRKVQDRVAKVKEGLQDAMTRGGNVSGEKK
mmetsp:Transcript_97445/g.297755  ORF Transcript_97445/g.297755 Transcript_97445/m.297755 type:complete len:901 (-) Transcript_97445:299-3001(-)